MTWWQVASLILLTPILLAQLLFVLVLIALRLPMHCCQSLRAVRYLLLAGLCYYGSLVLLSAVVLGRAWWEVVVLAAVAVLGGKWLLPDPISFLLNPGKRRAVFR